MELDILEVGTKGAKTVLLLCMSLLENIQSKLYITSLFLIKCFRTIESYWRRTNSRLFVLQFVGRREKTYLNC